MTIFESNLGAEQPELGLEFQAPDKFRGVSPAELGVTVPDTIDLTDVPIDKVWDWYSGKGWKGLAVGASFDVEEDLHIEGIDATLTLSSITLWEDGTYSCRFNVHGDRFDGVCLTDAQYNLIIPSNIKYKLRDMMVKTKAGNYYDSI